MKKITSYLIFLFSGLTFFAHLAHGEEYPARPIIFVVGYGVGGSSDKMARAMSAPLGNELGQPVLVVNKKGAATLLGLHYVLGQPADGYTVYAGALSPYMGMHVLRGRAKFTQDDWDVLNIQWSDYTLYAASKKSGFTSMADLLQAIKEKPGTVRGAVMQGSVGLLTLKMLLKQLEIPENGLNLVTYASGGKARAAVAGGVVDFIAIAAEGCHGIRDFLVPLAVGRKEYDKRWDVPGINEAISPLGIKVPVLADAMRGYAVPTQVRKEFPLRYYKLVTALQAATVSEATQNKFRRLSIGGRWVGPETATRKVSQATAVFTAHKELLVR